MLTDRGGNIISHPLPVLSKIFFGHLVRLIAGNSNHTLTFAQPHFVRSKYLVENRKWTAIKIGTILQKY